MSVLRGLQLLLAPTALACAGTGRAVVSDTVLAADGVPIRYDVRGAAPRALVLVHGWSCDRSYWDAQVEVLSTDYTVVTPDLAGHGESGLGRDAWTIESFGDDVATVVETLDLEEVVLAGHSMGGDVVVAAAPRLGDRVAGLVWVDTYSTLDSVSTPDRIRELVDSFRGDFPARTREFVRGMFQSTADPELVERVAADMASAPEEVALASLKSSFEYGIRILREIEGIEAPIVAINPDTPSTDLESMTRNGVEVVFVADVGHFSMLEDPEAFEAVLRPVVERMFHDGYAGR